MKECRLLAIEVTGRQHPTYLLVVVMVPKWGDGVNCTRGIVSIKSNYVYQPDIKGERADQRTQSAEARSAV